MDQPQKFHLLNCDNTYKLDVVESLLTAVKPKLDFQFSVEKHYFPLSQMAEMSTKTIPELQMDFAIFVVNANESCLSINEEKAGIGYAKVYRALLQATGEKVIVVIGGDDNYKNEDEEERVVLSRWSRRKVFSQFTEEFLDGRKSFVFSWDRKHRPIHEKALLHYFGKTGLKFEYQPKPKLPEKPANQSPVKTKPANQSPVKTDDREMKGENLNSGTKQPARHEVPKSDSYNRPERSREERSYSGTRPEESGRSSTEIPDSGQGARPKVNHSPTREMKGSYSANDGRATSVPSFPGVSDQHGEQPQGGHMTSYPAEYGRANEVSSDSCPSHPIREPPRGGLVRSYSADDGGANNVPLVQGSSQGDEQPAQGVVTSQSTNLPDIPIFTTRQGERVRVLVKAHLRKGRISREEGDIWFQDWEVPEYIRTSLMDNYSTTIRAELLIFIDNNGVLQCRVHPRSIFKAFIEDL